MLTIAIALLARVATGDRVCNCSSAFYVVNHGDAFLTQRTSLEAGSICVNGECVVKEEDLFEANRDAGEVPMCATYEAMWVFSGMYCAVDVPSKIGTCETLTVWNYITYIDVDVCYCGSDYCDPNDPPVTTTTGSGTTGSVGSIVTTSDDLAITGQPATSLLTTALEARTPPAVMSTKIGPTRNAITVQTVTATLFNHKTTVGAATDGSTTENTFTSTSIQYRSEMTSSQPPHSDTTATIPEAGRSITTQFYSETTKAGGENTTFSESSSKATATLQAGSTTKAGTKMLMRTISNKINKQTQPGPETATSTGTTVSSSKSTERELVSTTENSHIGGITASNLSTRVTTGVVSPSETTTEKKRPKTSTATTPNSETSAAMTRPTSIDYTNARSVTSVETEFAGRTKSFGTTGKQKSNPTLPELRTQSLSPQHVAISDVRELQVTPADSEYCYVEY